MEIIDSDDKDVKAFLRIVEKLKKRNITIDIVEDMAVLLDCNDETIDAYDRIIEHLGGCG